MVKSNLFKIVLFTLFIFLAIIPRTTWLGKVPMGVSDDELDYILTAQSVAYSGKNLDGTFKPFSFQNPSATTLLPYARVPYMILAPFYSLIQTDRSFARIPYVAISILTVLVITGITYRLFGSSAALCVMFITALNPWSIYFGRTAYEAPIAVFFAYTCILCVLILPKQWVMVSLIPWILGFYSYHGTNIIFLPILASAVLYVVPEYSWRRNMQYYVTLGIALGIMLMFIGGIRTSNVGNRLNEFILPNSQIITSQVNSERNNSIQTSWNSVFENKGIVFVRTLVTNYIGAFSINQLFLNGESRSTFSMWSHGWFYYLDLLLFVIGVYTLYTTQKKAALLLFSWILIGPIPAVVSSTGLTYALRASFMYPSMAICIGIGLLTILKKFRYGVMLVFFLCYMALVIDFLHAYFIRNPVNNSEGFGLSNRVMSSYIRLSSETGRNILFIGNGSLNIFEQYMFWANLMHRENITQLQHILLSHEFSIGNIRFVDCVKSFPDLDNITLIVPAGVSCGPLDEYTKVNPSINIAQLSDSGSIYKIYNDTLCNRDDLPLYQKRIRIEDLDIESMTKDMFCTTYLSR